VQGCTTWLTRFSEIEYKYIEVTTLQEVISYLSEKEAILEIGAEGTFPEYDRRTVYDVSYFNQ